MINRDFNFIPKITTLLDDNLKKKYKQNISDNTKES